MSSIWSMLASLIEGIANVGAGLASIATNYEPELPERTEKVSEGSLSMAPEIQGEIALDLPGFFFYIQIIL